MSKIMIDTRDSLCYDEKRKEECMKLFQAWSLRIPTTDGVFKGVCFRVWRLVIGVGCNWLKGGSV